MPAFSLGLVLAAGALMAAFAQFGAMGEAGREIWRHMTRDYLSGAGTVQGLGASLRWMEVTTLAVMAERTIRFRARVVSAHSGVVDRRGRRDGRANAGARGPGVSRPG